MKNRKLLSVMLAVAMLLTAFSATGLTVSAAPTAPGEGYVMDETIFKDTVWNKTANGTFGTYASVNVSSARDSNNQPTALTFTVTDFETMRRSSRLAASLGAHGNVMDLNTLRNMDDVYVSFDLTATGFVDSELRIEFRGKNASGGTTSTVPYVDIGFSVDLTEGTQHVCLPFSSFAHFNNLGDASDWVDGGYTGIYGIYLIFGKNYYSASCEANATFTISNFDFVNVSWLPEKETVNKALTGNGTPKFRYSAQKAYADFTAKTHSVNGTDYNGMTIDITEAGDKASAAAGFNTQNMMLYYELAEAVDLTEDWELAHLSFYIRFKGEISGKNTKTAPKLQVKLLTGNPITYNKGRFVNYTFATGEEWQKVDLTLSQLTGGHNMTTEIVKELVTAFEFVAVNAGSGTNAISATGDSIEIADLKLYKSVEAPIKPAGIDLKFSEASLTLEDSLTMNFKANASLFDSKYAAPYAMINGQKITGVLDGTQYVFSYTDIAPQSMHDTITATLHATYNGAPCEGKSIEYSVKKYCDALLKTTTDAKTRTLLVDLLNYGAAAQTYVNKRPNNLANRTLTAEQAAWGTAEDASLTSHYAKGDETGKSVTWKQAGLLLDNSVSMWVEFAAASKENLSVKVSDGTKELATITADQLVASANGYTAFFNGLNAKGMRRMLYITAYEGDTAVSSELAYSVESYADAAIKNDIFGDATKDANLDALVKALMKYGDAAFAYAAK